MAMKRVTLSYKWGKRVLFAHLLLLGLVLINALVNYFQSSTLDQYVTQRSLNATSDEIYYLSDTIFLLASVQAIYLVVVHLLSWLYARSLLRSTEGLSISGGQQLITLAQPVYGLRIWWRHAAARYAYETDSRPAPAGFLNGLWWIIMSGVIGYYLAFVFLLRIDGTAMDEGHLAQLSYTHLALAVASFWLLWGAISGWRSITRLQQLMGKLYADN